MDKLNKYKYPQIEVEWADHFFDSEDNTLEEIIETAKNPYMGKYTGYLVHENKRMLVLCANVWEDGTLSCPMYIMKKSITNRSDKNKRVS